MERTMKPCACANVDICPSVDGGGLVISAALPGVAKENIKLNMSNEEFCISGEREDLKYDCCYVLPCNIDEEKCDAQFDNGLLTIKAPLRDVYQGKDITIH